MTTYQEPPLQSRRAARQSERADSPPGGIPNQNAGIQAPASPAPLNPEPLNYATTTRPPLPQYDGQEFRPRRTAEAPGHADLPPTEALPRQDAPSYRPRDYSPEGRRSAVQNWAPSYEGVVSGDAGAAGTVEFHTQNREQALAGASASPSEGEHTMTRRELRALREAEGITAVVTGQTPVVAPYPAAAPQAAQAPAAAPAPEASVAPPALVPPAPQASTRLDSALAEFDALAAGRSPIALSPDAPAPAPGRRAAQQPPAAEDAQAPVAQAPVAQAPIAQAPIAQAPVAQAPVAQAPVARPSVAQPPAPQEPQDALSAFEALFAVPEPTAPAPQDVQAPSAAAQLLAPPIVEAAPAQAPAADPLLSAPAPQGAPAMAPPPSSPPSAPAAPRSTGPTSVGHWSTQSDIDDAEQVLETTISRSVGAGSGAITTSALVLPSVPERAIGGAMNSNGEILLTGSISLPHSLAAIGAHPSQLDESDLDHLLDAGDHQVANTDSMPVRAIRAVSTHTATGAIIAPTKQKGTRGFTILIVAASAMAVVVVGLLVAGLVSGTL